MLEAYMVELLAEEGEKPTLARVRAYISATLHPSSDAMKRFEHGDEADKIEPIPLTEFDPDAEYPFPGLDAPLGG